MAEHSIVLQPQYIGDPNLPTYVPTKCHVSNGTWLMLWTSVRSIPHYHEHVRINVILFIHFFELVEALEIIMSLLRISNNKSCEHWKKYSCYLKKISPVIFCLLFRTLRHVTFPGKHAWMVKVIITEIWRCQVHRIWWENSTTFKICWEISCGETCALNIVGCTRLVLVPWLARNLHGFKTILLDWVWWEVDDFCYLLMRYLTLKVLSSLSL